MDNGYNVFISWSGERSRLVAEFLRDWLSQVVQAVRPWMSESEVEKGSRSFAEIGRALADIKVGIICLTPENLDRPWLLYEAGCLTKSIDDRTRLCTYLIGGIEPSDVRPPLGMFQGTRANKNDTFILLRTINRVASDNPISDENLGVIFEAMWPKLESRLESLPTTPDEVPQKRPPEEVMDEILELVRGEASHRERTMLDVYIPTFQQLLPLLRQLIMDVNRRATVQEPILRYPTDTSLERTIPHSQILNTFLFPSTLRNAMPVDPRSSGRRLDLVNNVRQHHFVIRPCVR